MTRFARSTIGFYTQRWYCSDTKSFLLIKVGLLFNQALHLQLVWSYYKGGLIPYAAILRPHLEYAMEANAPTLMTDINQPDKVQRLATRLVRGLCHVPHEDADASELTSSWPSTLSNVKITLTCLTSSSAHPDPGHEGIPTDDCKDQAVFDTGAVSFLFMS